MTDKEIEPSRKVALESCAAIQEILKNIERLEYEWLKVRRRDRFAGLFEPVTAEYGSLRCQYREQLERCLGKVNQIVSFADIVAKNPVIPGIEQQWNQIREVATTMQDAANAPNASVPAIRHGNSLIIEMLNQLPEDPEAPKEQ